MTDGAMVESDAVVVLKNLPTDCVCEGSAIGARRRRVRMLTGWTAIKDIWPKDRQHSSCWREKTVWTSLRMILLLSLSP